jgi:hypothetical protein
MPNAHDLEAKWMHVVLKPKIDDSTKVDPTRFGMGLCCP